MATVVVTFFIIARFYVSKMDADFKEKRSAKIPTLTKKRWSMNSQRLEEIVAELMRPIGDLRHSFDTDLSALLEEYLTEAGLHALDAEEADEDGSGVGGGLAPNFAELALLLQQSASIYGRKVDCLYQHVLSVSDSLHNGTIELANTSQESAGGEGEAAEGGAAGASPRKRRAPAPAGFEHIELTACEGARREAGPARAPPTLPRAFVELEPRVGGAEAAPLCDYAGEPIGLLADYHVSWRLQNGLLVEELAGYSERAPLRPIPLLELQAAIEANAPPSPPPLREDTPPPPPASPPPPAAPAASTPPPPADMPPPPPPPPPPPLARDRKRKSDGNIEDFANGRVKLVITKAARRSLLCAREFDGAHEWSARVVDARARRLLLRRRRLRVAHRRLTQPLRGFDCHPQDIGGFFGWTTPEVESATALWRKNARLSGRLSEDSDDDGFFEQSSLEDSDASRVEDSPLDTQTATAAERSRLEEAAEWAAWRARQAARAAGEGAPPPLDVRALARTVLGALPPPAAAPAAGGGAPVPFQRLLRGAAREAADVSRLFLATLFLANAGNVEVVPGPPLSLNSFSLKLVSTDERLYTAAADTDPACAPPPAACAPPPAACAPPPAACAPPPAIATPAPAR